jgi:hypothetical protein
MNIKVFILSILSILSNIQPKFTQSVANNNLVAKDIQILLSSIQRSVREYLSTILINPIIQNVDVIFDSASLNISSIINKNYNCVSTNLTSINLNLK